MISPTIFITEGVNMSNGDVGKIRGDIVASGWVSCELRVLISTIAFKLYII